MASLNPLLCLMILLFGVCCHAYEPQCEADSSLVSTPGRYNGVIYAKLTRGTSPQEVAEALDLDIYLLVPQLAPFFRVKISDEEANALLQRYTHPIPQDQDSLELMREMCILRPSVHDKLVSELNKESSITFYEFQQFTKRP